MQAAFEAAECVRLLDYPEDDILAGASSPFDLALDYFVEAIRRLMATSPLRPSGEDARAKDEVVLFLVS